MTMPLVSDRRNHVSDESLPPLAFVLLAQENFILETVPATSPVFVRPAETERHLGPAAREHLVHGTLEDSAAVEPVVVEAKTVDAVFPGESSLCLRLELREYLCNAFLG